MNLCISRYLINSTELLVGDVKAKSLDFTTTNGQTLWTENVSTIAISLINRIIRLKNVAYTLDCNANLISLKQLCKSNITFVDDKNNLTLIEKRQEIAQTRRDYNLFILDLTMLIKVIKATLPEYAITAKSRGWPTHLISRNKRVWVWYQRIKHASNAKIIRVSKLFIEIGDFNAKYNSKKVYSNFK